ncbi:MAG: hypothetical protein SAMD01599839_12590 [Rectinema sp.]
MSPEEDISRFVMHTSDVKNSTNTLRYNRLLPMRNKQTGRLETSVCRSGELTGDELWTLCSQYFDVKPDKIAIGVGTAQASAIYKEGLNFDPNGQPFTQHADIIGWDDPAGIPDDEKKHFWMDKAQRIAPHFKFYHRPK